MSILQLRSMTHEAIASPSYFVYGSVSSCAQVERKDFTRFPPWGGCLGCFSEFSASHITVLRRCRRVSDKASSERGGGSVARTSVRTDTHQSVSPAHHTVRRRCGARAPHPGTCSFPGRAHSDHPTRYTRQYRCLDCLDSLSLLALLKSPISRASRLPPSCLIQCS